MLKLKPFRQKIGFCGPATLKMVLNYFGLEKTEQELAQATGCTKEKGIEADKIVAAAKQFGLKAQIKDNASFDDVKKYLNKKIPPIVDWFYKDDGHYSVVVDLDKENIYLLDPSIGHLRAVRLKKFYRIWFDFPGPYIKTKNDLILRRLIAVFK